MQFLCKRKQKIHSNCQSLLIQDEVHEDELDAEEEEEFCEMPGNFVIEFHFK